MGRALILIRTLIMAGGKISLLSLRDAVLSVRQHSGPPCDSTAATAFRHRGRTALNRQWCHTDRDDCSAANA
ncbi:hypothetical protein Sme01_18840 [Sphaerisporangium melleum]|uniref:Uncharacterized protein n=1 Tax=Sphaerisporangium melleum TaxID=321316 RepID=A0A917RRN8_9ACTN|nr:hypothetical protein GCM10007964_74650 [Sphaerisporangium melleum]GII69408.1 hypothetical protein Sme01_18840 [Sphaerisporangium melleum]